MGPGLWTGERGRGLIVNARYIKAKATLIGSGMRVGVSPLVLDEERNELFCGGGLLFGRQINQNI